MQGPAPTAWICLDRPVTCAPREAGAAPSATSAARPRWFTTAEWTTPGRPGGACRGRPTWLRRTRLIGKASRSPQPSTRQRPHHLGWWGAPRHRGPLPPAGPPTTTATEAVVVACSGADVHAGFPSHQLMVGV